MLHEGRVLAQHARCYERGQLIVLPDHRLAAIAVSRRRPARRWSAHLTHWGQRHVCSISALRVNQ